MVNPCGGTSCVQCTSNDVRIRWEGQYNQPEPGHQRPFNLVEVRCNGPANAVTQGKWGGGGVVNKVCVRGKVAGAGGGWCQVGTQYK